MRKLLAILSIVCFVLFCVLVTWMCTSYVYADEVADLQGQKNQISLRILQLQAQDQLLLAQLQEYVEKYVSDKAQIAQNIEKLEKARVGIDKQIKALESAPEAKE